MRLKPLFIFILSVLVAALVFFVKPVVLLDDGNNGINAGAENFIVATTSEELLKTPARNPVFKKKEPPLIKENIPDPILIKKDVPEISVATCTVEYQAVSTQFLMEDKINLQAIALVRCVFRSQYYESSTQPWNEQNYNVGTGVIISPKGIILTARHVLETPENLLNDPAGRKWERIRCDVALTDSQLDSIASVGFWGQSDDPKFRKAEIFYVVPDENYNETQGLDFSLLKIESAENQNFISLFSYLADFNAGDQLLLIGYPGRESASPQVLERFDGKFLILTRYLNAVCGSSGEPCGLRYVFRRYPPDYEKDFWKSTDFGIITPYFRGGFSGAPAFYKGNLMGIATHGASGSETKDGWDQAVILTSWDILEFLKNNNVVL